MKLYHTETCEDYNALMVELEAEGYKWAEGEMPTELSHFDEYGSETVVVVKPIISKKTIQYSDVAYQIENSPNEPIIEYKAKGDDEVTKKCEKCDIEYHDKKANYCSMCGNELAKKPEFTIGDYVTDDSENEPFVCKVEKIEDGDVHGNWYVIKNEYFDARFTSTVKKCRIATPEEIAEYKVVLNFRKHGRRPFEIKKGDFLGGIEFGKFIVNYKDIERFEKEDFISGRYVFLKTAEEVAEWLKK